MGTTYNANYGIGYEVQASDRLEENEDNSKYGLSAYLEDYLMEEFESFKTITEYGLLVSSYIVITNPFSKGLDLTWVKEALEYEMNRLGVEPIGELNSVGGMYVY